MLEKCVLPILELNWNQRLGHKKTKLSICHHTVHTTAKQVISRRRKNDNVFKMSKDEKYTCKACKNTVFHCQICKFVGFLLPSSSWLLKLPTCYVRRIEAGSSRIPQTSLDSHAKTLCSSHLLQFLARWTTVSSEMSVQKLSFKLHKLWLQ